METLRYSTVAFQQESPASMRIQKDRGLRGPGGFVHSKTCVDRTCLPTTKPGKRSVRAAASGSRNPTTAVSRRKPRQVTAQFVDGTTKPSAATYEDQDTEDLLLSCSTFNVLAPIYKRLGGREDVRESQFPEQWRPRNHEIVQQLLAKKSSIICLQELWLSNPELVALYVNALGAHGYETFKLPRPNDRGDGLLTAVRTGKLEVVEQENLSFNDCGDRVAQLLWVRSRPECCRQGCSFSALDAASPAVGKKLGQAGMAPCQEVIVINTHLLFPHDKTSSFIRLRQVYKVLEHLEAFKAKHNLESVPVVICGDLNGTKRGQVYHFLRSQGFVSSYDIANNHPDTDQRWVSHRNHHGVVCGVDYIWLWNPKEKQSELALDWKAAVFKYLQHKLENSGCEDEKEVFSFFCNPEEKEASQQHQEGGDDVITLSSMESAVAKIGTELALTKCELGEIMAFADLDGKGSVCFQKFQSVIKRAESAADLSMQQDLVGRVPPMNGPAPDEEDSSVGFTISDATLYPPEMEKGIWPSNYTLSDHALLTAVFSRTEGEQE